MSGLGISLSELSILVKSLNFSSYNWSHFQWSDYLTVSDGHGKGSSLQG